MKLSKLALSLLTLVLNLTGIPFATAQSEDDSEGVPHYTKEETELNTLRHFIRLEGEKGAFYKITGIETFEVTSPAYYRPGLRTRINFETAQCKNNYYEGTVYQYYCNQAECPVAIVYQKCL
jgi:hypothetical protein